MRLLKASSMTFSMSQRSCWLMPPGSGNALRLRPVRTRIEVSPNPSFVRSSLPSSGRPSTPSSDQLFTWLSPAGTLWYLRMQASRYGVSTS